MNEVRRTVTAVFCDLVESTRLGETLDPETLHEVLSAYYEEMSSIARQEGGRVEKYIGDAVVAVFGVPRARHDDAIRAVRAAVRMREAIKELGERESRRLGIRLRARIGINTGEVISKQAPDGNELVIGDAMNTAARIQTAAPIDGILIGGTTFELAANWAIVKPAPPVEAKGKSKPVAVHELLDVVKGPTTSSVGDSFPIIGRTVEITQLEAALKAAKSGSPTLVLLTGPPGIGKSRLAREFLKRANATSLRMRCQPPGDESRIGGTERLDPDRTLPEVLVVDDAHWAEGIELSETLKALESPAGKETLGIFIGRPELIARLGDTPGFQTHELALGPLAEHEIRRLVQTVAGNVDHEVCTQIEVASNGNPLHARELARSATAGGPAAMPREVPKSIKALLTARVDELPANERFLLENASIIGHSLDEDDLVALSESIDEGNSSDVTPLISRGILVVISQDQDSGGRTLAFENSTIREIVYESMLKRPKAERHERYARLLMASEELGRPEQIASHLIGAAENQSPTSDGRRHQSELAHEAAVTLTDVKGGTVLQSRVATNLAFRVAKLLGRPIDDDETAVSARNLPAQTASLTIEETGGGSRTVRLEAARGRFNIGRLPDCDIPLPGDPEVSRSHASVSFEGGWRIEDLDSRNGVRVNGQLIGQPTPIESGDQIELGLTKMRFRTQIS